MACIYALACTAFASTLAMFVFAYTYSIPLTLAVAIGTTSILFLYGVCKIPANRWDS